MLRWLLLHVGAGYARRHPLRTTVQILAIATGVALGFAINRINASALDEFSGAVRQVMGQADFTISGGRDGFDDALVDRIASMPEVEIASPIVEIEAPVPSLRKSTAGRSTLRVLGIDVFRAALLAPALIGEPSSTAGNNRMQALLGDGLFLSAAALARMGLKPGDELVLQVSAATASFLIAGTLPVAGSEQELAVIDIAAAQTRFGQLGRVHRIDIQLAANVSPAAARERITALLPPGVWLSTLDEATQKVSNISRAYRVNLNVLALVALFTGAFLVFSLQAQAVVARRVELAFLRMLGLTAHELHRLLVIEAVVTGLIGSLLGLALGALLAGAALGALGSDLGSGFFAGGQAHLQLDVLSSVMFLLLGTAAAVAGSWVPARQAARVEPAIALKSGTEVDELKPLARSVWPALAIAVVGVALAFMPPLAGLPLAGYASIALMLIAAIMVQPRLAHAVFGWLGRASRGASNAPWLGATTRLAQAPSAAAIGLAGIVASFALMVAMATMVTSFRQSLDVWLGQVLPADLYARAGSRGEVGTTAHFSARDQVTLGRASGVQRVEFSRFVRLSLDPQRSPVTLIVRALDADAPGLPLIGDARTWNRGEPAPVWISEAMVELYAMHTGDRITLPLAGNTHEFIVAGIWRDYARQSGAISMRDIDYQRITGDTTRTDAALWLAPGTRAVDVIEAVRGELDAGDNVEFRQPGELRKLSLAIFDRSFAVTYLLEIAAIVIGLVGVAATFSAQAFARSREFGMLRHIGMTRRQILGQFAFEGALVALLGIASGLVAGFAVALVLINVVNPQSFHWTMTLSIPSGLLITLVAALLVTATLTAALAARRAVSGEAVRSVREDW